MDRTETVVSFASPKEKEDKDAGGQHLEGDILARIYNDVNGDYAKPCDDCFDFAALVVFHSVKALLDHTDSPDLQVFRIFEEYISDLVSDFFDQFQSFYLFLLRQSSRQSLSKNSVIIIEFSPLNSMSETFRSIWMTIGMTWTLC